MLNNQLRQPDGEDIAAANRRRGEERQVEEMRLKRLSELMNKVGPRYSACKIDTFKFHGTSVEQSKQKTIVDKFQTYVESINSGHGSNLGLIGSVGTGKDHLLCSAMFAASDKGLLVEWKDGTSLFREFRSIMDGIATENEILKPLFACDILSISDPVPPSGGLSPFVQEKLFSVIDYRYRMQKPVWWTLNAKTPTDAEERLSPQIWDRITEDALLLVMDWPSHRKSQRWRGPTNAG